MQNVSLPSFVFNGYEDLGQKFVIVKFINPHTGQGVICDWVSVVFENGVAESGNIITESRGIL